jgi:predicted transcriptional regulator YheO
LHDTNNLELSIVLIENSHLTGRKVGGPITDLGLYFLKSDRFKDKDFIANYQTESQDGKILKSTTIFIRNNQRKIIGFLCINYAIDRFLKIGEVLNDFSRIDKNLDEDFSNNNEKDELFVDNMDDLLEKLFKKAKDKVGRPIEKFKKNNKLEVVEYLQKRGVFWLKEILTKLQVNLIFHVIQFTIIYPK